MLSMVNYLLASPGVSLGDAPVPGKLYDYVFSRFRVLVRARREGLRACVPVGEADVRGLLTMEPEVALEYPRVPAALLKRALSRAVACCVEAGEPREILFYFVFEDWCGWRLVEPEQEATAVSVHPVDTAGEDYARAIIELHSHNHMDAFFSSQDDADEQGFRVYAVMGRIFSEPRLRVRVGVYGHFHEIPAGDIFELPEGLRDARESEK